VESAGGLPVLIDDPNSADEDDPGLPAEALAEEP